jgi:hypothetical protein
MGFQPFFRKPQLHRPYAPAAHHYLDRPRRATNFFRARAQQHTRPTRPAPAAEAAPTVNPPLLPLASQLVMALVVFLSLVILLMLVLVR